MQLIVLGPVGILSNSSPSPLGRGRQLQIAAQSAVARPVLQHPGAVDWARFSGLPAHARPQRH
ncbi:hypothetical protein GCM10027440_01140 [Nocardiopsis coralliicola]